MCTYDSILIGAQTTRGTLSQQLLCFAIIQLTEGLVRWFDGNTEIIARKRRLDNQLDLLFSGELRISATGTATFQNRTYWKSWSDAANAQKNWVDAGTFCRSLCMDLVALDSPGETDFVSSLIQPGDLLLHCLGCSGLSSRSFVCSYC